MKKNIRAGMQLFLSMLANPIFIAVYLTFFYYLELLCRVGKSKNTIAILVLCGVFFIIYLTVFIVKIVKSSIKNKNEDNYELLENIMNEGVQKRRFKFIWHIFSVVLIVFITAFYGAKIYHSATNLNGKLAWFLKDLKDKKEIKLQHNNIYKDDISGVLEDIKKKISMPEKLYVSNSFKINFREDGTILSFDTFLYGKNDNGKTESFLVSYDNKKSNDIIVYLNGYVNADYNDYRLLQPFLSAMKVIKLKEATSTLGGKEYSISYSGKVNLGYNEAGVLYVDKKGSTKICENTNTPAVGYAVSLNIVGTEYKRNTPLYVYTEDIKDISSNEGKPKENKSGSNDNENVAEQFYLNKKLGYRLEVTSAAAGRRAYSLATTLNGGSSWETLNSDPFSGRLGVAAGITFLNEKLGFLCLSENGGGNGDLYRTEDGGLTYKKVDIPRVQVNMQGKNDYTPFDLPEMPYEKNGILNMLVGQGSDGDYNGGIKALYESKDEGRTWSYLEQINK